MKQSNSQAMSFGPDQRVQFMQIPPLDVLGLLRMAWQRCQGQRQEEGD